MLSRLMAALRGAAQSQTDRIAQTLYAHAVEQARQPVFYADWGVPDTLDGRFEMICLHVHAVLRRLRRGAGAGQEEAQRIAQALFDHMMGDMDRGLREIGVSDVVVGNRVKDMAKALFGRIAAYDEGLDAEDAAVLIDALRRNAYGTVVDTPADNGPAVEGRIARLAAYCRALEAALADSLLTQPGVTLRFPRPADFC